ncbi:MAG: hypothetical protein JW936_10230 [Sedimentisphaerales bacterium]|nr:hypothetical protein [Sedimentisphaerales bacterium]
MTVVLVDDGGWVGRTVGFFMLMETGWLVGISFLIVGEGVYRYHNECTATIVLLFVGV